VAPIGKNGNSAALDIQLCWAYQLAAELEEALGMKEFAERYHAAAEQLKQTIKSKYWSSNHLFADTPEQTLYSQHTNTLAILAEVISGNEATQLAKKILSDTSLTQATIYFKYYVHQAIAKVGLGDSYLNLLGDWRAQLSNGLTTWAEISDHNNSRSDCHAWGSSPNIEFFRIILGIDSESPGFSKVKIKPHLGSLSQAQGKMPHPNGHIAVNYFQVKGKWKAEITLPEKTLGTFYWKDKTYPLTSGKTTLDL
jgi:alpha-L-rhamnosidase